MWYAWADEVRGRVVGSISDLHAAEARYYRDCMCRLFAKRLSTTAQEGQSQTSNSYYQPDMALKHLITMLSSDKKRVWSSVELCQEYHHHGGIDLTQSQLVENLCSHFDGDLLLISSPGCANDVAFQCHAAVSLKMYKYQEYYLENSIRHVAKKVILSMTAVLMNKPMVVQASTEHRRTASPQVSIRYCSESIGIDIDEARQYPSAMLIGNIITSVVRNKATDLQVALGVILRDYKAIFGYTYDYGITYSYDEIRQFKKSAAADPSVHGISSAEGGLVQTAVDNFDADIHSPNGKLSTHSLAMILTQPSSPINDHDAVT